MLSLKSNWKDVALRAWSMYALYISLTFQAADTLMPYFIDYTSPVWVKGVAFIITVFAGYFRLVPQNNLQAEDPKWHSSNQSAQQDSEQP